MNLVEFKDLYPGMEILSPVHAKLADGKTKLLVEANTLVDVEMIDMFKSYGIKHVDARKKSIENSPVVDDIPQNAPKNTVKKIISDDFKQEAVDNIQQLFMSIDSVDSGNMTTAYQSLSGIENIVGNLVEAATSDPSGLVHIHDLRSHDEYTYHHSLSVALLSIATGQAMGLYPSDLTRLGKCAILHDIGKQFTPLEIINKPGKLTDEEFTTMKDHPTSGSLSLKAKAIGDMELWSAVMFHHEKYNGTGYPKGLKKNEIPLFARIIAVADVYDAVTSYRSYRKPMPPSHAFEIICSEVERAFDYDIVKAFMSKIDMYPIGSVVELSDKTVGKVIMNEQPTRPVVQTETGIIDLSSVKNLTITVNRVLS